MPRLPITKAAARDSESTSPKRFIPLSPWPAPIPQAGVELTVNTRRVLIKRFPFGVIYQPKGEVLYVIAVADLRRRSDYWLSRLNH